MVVIKAYAKEIVIGCLLVVCAAAGSWHYSEISKLNKFKAQRAVLLTGLNELQAIYIERGHMLREWTKTASANERDELRVLLSENDGLKITEPIEMQRFDFVQERLNMLTTKWAADKKLAKLKPSGLDSMDRNIQRARMNYSRAAFELNKRACSRCAGLELHIFPAEKGYLTATR